MSADHNILLQLQQQLGRRLQCETNPAGQIIKLDLEGCKLESLPHEVCQLSALEEILLGIKMD
jgi:hypothetical protein